METQSCILWLIVINHPVHYMKYIKYALYLLLRCYLLVWTNKRNFFLNCSTNSPQSLVSVCLNHWWCKLRITSFSKFLNWLLSWWYNWKTLWPTWIINSNLYQMQRKHLKHKGICKLYPYTHGKWLNCNICVLCFWWY